MNVELLRKHFKVYYNWSIDRVFQFPQKVISCLMFNLKQEFCIYNRSFSNIPRLFPNYTLIPNNILTVLQK